MELLDTDGNRFPIAVTGTTDNSLLTLQPFLTRQGEGCQLVQREGKPVMLLSKEAVANGGPNPQKPQNKGQVLVLQM